MLAKPKDRFRPPTPQIPGLAATPKAPVQQGFKPMRLLGFVAGMVVCLFVVRWIMLPKPRPAVPAGPIPKIEVPAPAPDPKESRPLATPTQPEIADVDEMAPWTAKDFFYKNRLSGENLPALLVRLPGGPGNLARNYWAFSVSAPYGSCRLEYVTDMDRLRNEYSFREAKHPMVGNPCSRTLYDPLKMMSIPGGAWVRGAIVQGSDLRPPLGIEVEIHDRQVLAARME